MVHWITRSERSVLIEGSVAAAMGPVIAAMVPDMSVTGGLSCAARQRP
ncbi:hypothetical protein I546_1696 [Mycobacterium kansasii 732]|nr:hypothetical protein I546_1696 [Mycobacterium kansasii 732]